MKLSIFLLLFGCAYDPIEIPVDASTETATEVKDCVVTNPLADTYLYSCEQDSKYRCDDSLGHTKYVNCWYGKAHCVESCQ